MDLVNDLLPCNSHPGCKSSSYVISAMMEHTPVVIPPCPHGPPNAKVDLLLFKILIFNTPNKDMPQMFLTSNNNNTIDQPPCTLHYDVFTHLNALRTGYTAGVFKATREIHTLSLRWTCVVGQSAGVYVNFTVLSLKTCKKNLTHIK